MRRAAVVGFDIGGVASIALGCVALILAMALTVGTRGGGGGEARFPQPGSDAPDFRLPTLLTKDPWIGSDTVQLSDFRGRWVYLDVFGSWCLPCQVKHPTMQKVARQFRDDGGIVLGLLLEDRPAAAARWFQENGGMGYPFVVLDDETVRAWQITGAPMGFLISPEGKLERICYGCSEGADAVERLLEVAR